MPVILHRPTKRVIRQLVHLALMALVSAFFLQSCQSSGWT